MGCMQSHFRVQPNCCVEVVLSLDGDNINKGISILRATSIHFQALSEGGMLA